MSRILETSGTKFDAEVPVVIIGAGACGLVAALKAADLGAETLILEQDDTPTGSTSLSSGFIPAAGTRFQLEMGIQDDTALFAEDIQNKARGLAQPLLASTAARHCGPTLEWLADAHGLEWVVIDDFLYPGHSRHRMHAVPERTGIALMARLLNAVEAADISIATGAQVTGLFADGNAIRGVEVERGDGTKETIGCDALVLASCGYGASRDLIVSHIPEMEGALYFGHAGNRGDALMWGERLGAAVSDLTGYQGHGSVATPHGILISWALMMQGGVQVNLSGRRFANEHLGYSEQAVPVLQQPEGVAWCLYDERIHEAGLAFDDYRQAVVAGAIRQGDNISELCRNTHLPENQMMETFGEISAFRRGEQKDPLDRKFLGEVEFVPPYYAVKVTGAMFHTQGGLLIDQFAQVLAKDGRPFANLFAGGGAACGVSGPHASGYLSGNGLLTAVTFGALAGEGAAKLVRTGLS